MRFPTTAEAQRSVFTAVGVKASEASYQIGREARWGLPYPAVVGRRV
jgi:hypothetical protein